MLLTALLPYSLFAVGVRSKGRGVAGQQQGQGQPAAGCAAVCRN